MSGRRRAPRRAGALVKAGAVLALVALVSAGCGHRIPTDELIAANSQVLDEPDGPANSAPGAGAPMSGEPGPESDAAPGPETADAGAPSSPVASGGSPGATAPTGGASAGQPAPGGQGSGRLPSSPAGSGGSESPSRPQSSASTAPRGTPQPGTGAAPSTPGETGKIVIGSVGNYSGVAAPPQLPMARAAQVWVEYTNSRGGLFGRPLQMIVVDDRGDPAQHVAALRDLVERSKVVAFVANAAALTVPAGRQYLESVGVPVIGTECAHVVEFESPIFFPQCEGFSDFFYSFIRAGVQFGGTKPTLAFITCSEAQTCSDGYNELVNKGLAEQAGAEIVYTAKASLAQPDFTSECRAAKAAGAEMLHALLDPTGVIRVARSCARQGYHPLFVQGSATIFQESKDQPGLENLVVTGQVFNFVGTETPARREFHDVMASFYGNEPGPGEAYGWAAAKLFEAAATRAATVARSVNPASLVAALNTMTGETLGGLTVPLTFPAGKGAQPAPCAFSARGQNGQWIPLNGGRPLCRS